MQRLKQWLEDEEKTQSWLATQMDVSQPTVSDWINGNMSPTVENLRRLSSITDLSIDALLGFDAAQRPKVMQHVGT